MSKAKLFNKYFENPRKLVNVKTDDDYNLHLTFDNGEVRIYNMQKELKGVFAVLKDKNRFQFIQTTCA